MAYADPQTGPNSPEDSDPVSSRKKIGYWLKWIEGAKKAAESHWADSKAAWSEYEKRAASPADSRDKQDDNRPYPGYWVACKILEPAYYSRTPNFYARRRFNIQDPQALTMGLVAERLTGYLVEDSCFDSVMRAAVKDFIHADKTTTQVTHETETQMQKVRVAVTQRQGAGGKAAYYADGSDSSFSGEVLEDQAGTYYEEERPVVVKQRVVPKQVCYDEVLHSPEAKAQDEITEEAFYFCISKEEAEAQFPNIRGMDINWLTSKTYKREEHEKDATDIPGKYIDGWEVCCKATKTKYWVSESHPNDFLHTAPDDYELRNFFPAPEFVIGSKPAKSLFPTPVYVHLAPTLQQLHMLYNKIFGLIRAIRRRALIDGSTPEVVQAFSELDDREFISIQNLNQIIEKSGIQNLIWYIPVQELTTALKEALELEDHFKNSVYEWFGVPDILRGVSDPIETLGAQEIKTGAAHDRFKDAKKQIAQLARNTAELMLDLALKKFDDQFIARVCGYQYMTPEHQQRFLPALQALRNDTERMIRIEVEDDTTSFIDQNQQAQRRNMAVQTVTSGMQSVSAIAKENPQMAVVALQTLLYSLDGVGGGKEFEDGIKSAVGQLLQQLMQPPPPAPPPPDYEMMKLQMQGQKQQIDAQVAARELQQKDIGMQLEARDQQLREVEQAQAASIESFKVQMQSQLDRALLVIEQQRVAIEQFKAQTQAQESAMEEIRMAREADVAALEAVTQPQALPQAPSPPQIITMEAPPMPPININVDAGRPGRRIGRIIRDEMGNARVEVEEELPSGP